MSKSRWYGPSARPEQGPLPEGGGESYVYAFYFLRSGQPEGSGEEMARLELTPEEYRAQGGRRGVARLIDQQRRAWANQVRYAHLEGSVIVVKTRGVRKRIWAAGVPM